MKLLQHESEDSYTCRLYLILSKVNIVVYFVFIVQEKEHANIFTLRILRMAFLSIFLSLFGIKTCFIITDQPFYQTKKKQIFSEIKVAYSLKIQVNTHLKNDVCITTWSNNYVFINDRCRYERSRRKYITYGSSAETAVILSGMKNKSLKIEAMLHNKYNF